MKEEQDRIMEVVVEDMQLSLAIGKKGQNVRLAAKLTGWRIDIKSEEEKRREVEEQFGTLEIEEGADTEGDVTQGEPLSATPDEGEAVIASDDAPAEVIQEATAEVIPKATADVAAEAVGEAEVGEKQG